MEPESPMKPLFLDEEWLIRRSERIFLSDPSPQPSPNYTQSTKQSVSKPQTKAEPKSKSDQAKLQKAKNMKELTQKVKRKYKKSMEKRTSMKAMEMKKVIIFFKKWLHLDMLPFSELLSYYLYSFICEIIFSLGLNYGIEILAHSSHQLRCFSMNYL